MMTPRKRTATLAAGAAALSLAAAGGYMAHAGVAAEGAVNAHPISSGTPNTFADIIQRVAPAVVSIEVEGRRGAQDIAEPAQRGLSPFVDPDDSEGGGSPFDLRRFFAPGPQDAVRTPFRGAGSGFFISSDGYLVTNNHVVAGAQKISVHTADERTLTAQVVGRDPATDLAVLKVQASNLPFVSFEERAKPRVGDWVVAIGNPFNLGGTATAGIVSALGRKNVSDSSFVDYMQIDAPINRGNSGGPTFDLSGRVVGVNTAIVSPSGGSVGIGFDIPADVAASVSHQLIARGKVSRGYIGATIQDVTPEIASSLGLTGKGALVADVLSGGPAEAAGLRSGDLILRVNGEAVGSAADVTRRVAGVSAGDTIRLDVRRDGGSRQLAITSAVRPSEDVLASGASPLDAPSIGAEGLGLRVTPQTSGAGVRVAAVAPWSDAARKGLRPGDVIVQAGVRRTRTPADLARAVAEAREAGRKSVLLLVARAHQQIFVPVEPTEG